MTYTALGHIHKAQRVAGHETVRYAGAPLSMTFAEIHYHHGVQLITLEGKDDIKIDRLEYQPLVNLLSLPQKDSFTPADIVKRLSDLLSDISDEDVQTKSYLEIKVELDSPDPSLQNKIDEVLSQKAVRFCRIKNTLQPLEVNNTSEIKTLEQITPAELAQLIYEDHNGVQPCRERLSTGALGDSEPFDSRDGGGRKRHRLHESVQGSFARVGACRVRPRDRRCRGRAC